MRKFQHKFNTRMMFLFCSMIAVCGLMVGTGIEASAADLISTLSGGVEIPSFAVPTVSMAGFGLFPLLVRQLDSGGGDGGDPDPDPKPIDRKAMKDMIDNFNTKMTEMTEKQTELEGLIKANGENDSTEEIKALTNTLKQLEVNQVKASEIQIKQGEYLSGLSMPSTKDIEVKTLRGAIAKALVDPETAKSLENFKSGNSKSFNFDIDLKATIDIGNVSGSTYGERDNEIGKKPVRRVILGSLFRNRKITDPNNNGLVKYVDQDVLTRGADTVNRCTLLPTSNITWIERSCKIEKIGDSIKLCIDALEDLSILEQEVRDFITENVQLKYDEQLLLGDGISPNLKGVDLIAPNWVAGSFALDVPLPSIFDVIKTGVAQISDSGQNSTYFPNVILMNNTDWTKATYVKDENGQYIIPPFVDMTNLTISGAAVFITPLVPANEMYIGDFTKGTVYNHRVLNIQMATENESDFLEDLIALKVTRRDALVIKNVHNGAFLHVASISQAIIDLIKP